MKEKNPIAILEEFFVSGIIALVITCTGLRAFIIKGMQYMGASTFSTVFVCTLFGSIGAYICFVLIHWYAEPEEAKPDEFGISEGPQRAHATGDLGVLPSYYLDGHYRSNSNIWNRRGGLFLHENFTGQEFTDDKLSMAWAPLKRSASM